MEASQLEKEDKAGGRKRHEHDWRNLCVLGGSKELNYSGKPAGHCIEIMDNYWNDCLRLKLGFRINSGNVKTLGIEKDLKCEQGMDEL